MGRPHDLTAKYRMKKTEKDTGNTRGFRIAVFAAALLILLVSAAVAKTQLDHSISGNTRDLMSGAAQSVEECADIDVKELFPISNDTKELMSVGTMVMQNPVYLTESNKVFRKVNITGREQKKIVRTVLEVWPESRPPYNNGYAGLCEKWVCDAYGEAGFPTVGSCCAARSRAAHAVTEGDIPVGAMIYSGDEYRSGTVCEICGNDPGHVAIYLGDGKVAGSQNQYIMSLDDFKKYYGYGGWAFGGNKYIETEF